MNSPWIKWRPQRLPVSWELYHKKVLDRKPGAGDEKEKRSAIEYLIHFRKPAREGARSEEPTKSVKAHIWMTAAQTFSPSHPLLEPNNVETQGSPEITERKAERQLKYKLEKKRVNKANYGALAHHRNQARSQDSVKREGVL